MATPEVGIEAGKFVGYTGFGMFLLKMASLMLNKVERYRSAQSSEMDSTFKTGAAMREELRKDNEALRDRITAAEERVDALELELHGVRAENEKLRLKLERMETEMRPTDSGARFKRNDEGGLE